MAGSATSTAKSYQTWETLVEKYPVKELSESLEKRASEGWEPINVSNLVGQYVDQSSRGYQVVYKRPKAT